ncbi:hypothetical protein [Nonomuraea sp. LPB2021202275-12-8]|uniref:hypothetical protein n=1 Tax=Nonomuraea sp. LPB2021202275-12-8 TaxID=3120159 RepID=UPI00300D0158
MTLRPLPEIPECDVRRDESGAIVLTHRRSGQTAVVEQGADIHVAAAILRLAAAYRTGDPA